MGISTTSATLAFRRSFLQKGILKSRRLTFIKGGLICFNENALKMIDIGFYFVLKALFVLEIFTFLSWLFG